MFVFRGLNFLFRLQENNTTVKTEIFAGLTTYLTMVYIVIVYIYVAHTKYSGFAICNS